ncbi:winged helix-turn-helix transcriptional regulator [Streptacidiphilus neutrinimicus]|uniref:winged helix-turn-helix transcriptional regulator n=1 Tax=Streptacidiphilus neutrinimicus TaxID=105420 RepID=UPI0005A6CF65|nr:helix-turn-helix domain-containing protein [Streptacidiphilus neutrinimicus]
MADAQTPTPVHEDFDVFARDCPSRPALEHITGRWGVLVLAALRELGVARFGEVRRKVDGISEKMLSQTLHTLERDGFADRIVVAAMPPHVEYRLTPLGQETAARLLDLIEHLHHAMPAILAAQDRYEAAQAAPGA